jgi:tetratricopeptide (TPR) repeat protein
MLQVVLAFILTLQAGANDEILFTGLGPHTRAVTTSSPKAQQFFNQGLNFLYAFNHAEAKRSFRAAVKYDPECAMAWWGLAMANGPHINAPFVPPDDEKEAVEALQKAMAKIQKARPADQALIRATLVRFKWPQAEDRAPLDRAFADEMRKVWKRYPRDADVGAWFAESMMELRPWDLWTQDRRPQPGTPEIVATLERVLRLNPRHPFGLHLYIHAVEASSQPEKARLAADRLRDLQPALGHNVHMPSHIDIRLGDWKKAIVANEKAIAADAAYRAKRPEQRLYRVYMAHNHHMLALAAMMTGQSKPAIKEIDRMVAEMPEDFKKEFAAFVDGFFSMPFEVRVRFGLWDEVLSLPEMPDYFPISRALRHAARAVAYAAKGMPQQARSEQAMFASAVKQVPKEAAFGNNSAATILAIAEHLMNGEILVAEGKTESAIEELRLAVKAEDVLRYNEPPDWIQPTRHTLGVVLLTAGRHAEAAAVYRDDLKVYPNNGWSLYGLAESLKRLGREKEAAEVRAKFDTIWKDADIAIRSSCLCLPGK